MLLHHILLNDKTHLLIHLHFRRLSPWRLNELNTEAVLNCCLLVCTKSRQQLEEQGHKQAEIRGGGGKYPDTANFERLKHRFVLTVPNDPTQSVLMVQEFNPISSAVQKGSVQEKESHPVGQLLKRAVLGGDLGACVCFSQWVMVTWSPHSIFHIRDIKSQVIPSSTVGWFGLLQIRSFLGSDSSVSC